MNLIKVFNKTIAEIGIPVLEQPIFNSAPVGIRFEIGGEENVYTKGDTSGKLYANPKYVKKAVERALAIFNALGKKEWLLRIDLYSEREIRDSMKLLGLMKPAERVLKEYEVDGKHISHYELYWALNQVDDSVETIIREIVLSDIGGLSSLASAVYLLQADDKILYHLYDDRGLDLVAKERDTLYPLYERFNDWILDFDREKIDKMFNHKQQKFELNHLLDFLNQLEDRGIYYDLNKFDQKAIIVEIYVPGERWEVEFLENGHIHIEKFKTNHVLYGASELNLLFRKYSVNR